MPAPKDGSLAVAHGDNGISLRQPLLGNPEADLTALVFHVGHQSGSVLPYEHGIGHAGISGPEIGWSL